MKTLLTIVFLVLCVNASSTYSQGNSIAVAGVKFDSVVQVGGKTLTLNGVGVRTKSVFKVYAIGLYLAEPKKTTAEILSLAGAKRLTIVMLRDVSTDDLRTSFMAAITANSTREERIRNVSSVLQFGEHFETAPSLKKGDIIMLDWIPGSGLRCYLNDELVGDAISDAMFYQSVLKVWLGDRAVNSTLKAELLKGPAGGTEERKSVGPRGRKVSNQND